MGVLREKDSVCPRHLEDAVDDELHRDRGDQEPHHAADRARARSPRNISNATPKRTMPPAIRNAGIVNPNPAKIHWPNTANTPRVIVAVRHAFEMMFCFWAASMSSVRIEKNGTTPRGSTIAKMEAMAVAPNAKSTMVVPETDGGPSAFASVSSSRRSRRRRDRGRWRSVRTHPR